MNINYKYLGVIGLILLVASRLILAYFGESSIQKTFDFAHLLMLIGAVLTLALSLVFPKNIFNTLATSLTILGVIAHIGMCAIDMVFWSFGDNDAKRNELIIHLINTPAIWLPFFVIGPSLLFIGLSLHGWYFIKKQPLNAFMAILGAIGIGLGQLVWNDQFVIMGSYIVFTLGLSLLAFRQNKVE